MTIVPVLCSRWLKTPDEEAQATGIMARFYRLSERFLEAMERAGLGDAGARPAGVVGDDIGAA